MNMGHMPTCKKACKHRNFRALSGVRFIVENFFRQCGKMVGEICATSAFSVFSQHGRPAEMCTAPAGVAHSRSSSPPPERFSRTNATSEPRRHPAFGTHTHHAMSPCTARCVTPHDTLCGLAQSVASTSPPSPLVPSSSPPRPDSSVREVIKIGLLGDVASDC